jgi:hypothetical protein
VDYTGGTSYTGSQTTGTSLIPELLGYNYADPIQQKKVFGAVNVSAAGVKETVVFNLQQFMNVEFKYEPKANLLAWNDLMEWLIQQSPFDFTPEIASPSTYYPVTLETTAEDGKGLAFLMKEMLPNFPNFYMTGPMKFRIVLNYSSTVYIS